MSKAVSKTKKKLPPNSIDQSPDQTAIPNTPIKSKMLLYGGIAIASLLGLWLVLSLVLVQISGGMIFKQERSIHTYPLSQNYSQEFFDLDDETTIDAVYYNNPRADIVVLYLHGNSGRIPHLLTEFDNRFDYYSPANPGFHFSEGSPNTASVFETSEGAYQQLLEKGYSPNQIVIYGHSLGGPAALNLANKHPDSKAVVLVNSISSVRQICMRSYSIFCIFGGNIMNGIKEASKLPDSIQVYQYHLVNDQTVPYEEGAKLFDAIESNNKSFEDLDGSTHSFYDVNQTLQKVE